MISLRNFAFGASTPWKRPALSPSKGIRCKRGRGTSAASARAPHALTQVSGFAYLVVTSPSLAKSGAQPLHLHPPPAVPCKLLPQSF